MTIKIGKKIIGENSPVFIIAEAGVNHNGSLKLAKKLIQAAKYSGADAVKFQTFKTEEVVSRNTKLLPYQKNSSKGAKTQFEMLKYLELGRGEHFQLMAFAKKIGITFISTPGDFPSVRLLDELGVPVFKVGSDDLTNAPLLRYIASRRKPILLSTGMADIKEVDEAINGVIRKVANVPIVVMHATTEYPCPLEDVNMHALTTLKNTFHLPVGYSDHTAGVSASMSAVTLGACVIEKHLTLSRKLPGPDQKSSYEPEEFRVFIKLIREVESCLGSCKKGPTKKEKKEIKFIRKGIVAGRNLPKGTVLKRDDLAIKRPQAGLLPKDFFKVIGRKVKRAILKDAPIKRGDLN